ncbi:MAG: hypothetical protein KIT22_05165 [Verrucomicrobiae bacterium]|nr:hypothetical protein [Verrucomicrobiae bacterium]
MNILVIPEDFRKDQYILQPIIEAMFAKLGKPVIVEVLRDPLIGGIEQAMKREVLEEIRRDNQWKVDLFLLCVDRDTNSNRRSALDALEEHFNGSQATANFMVTENAWQELEVWVLAGHDLPPEWSWGEIRRERDPKEVYFDKLVAIRGLQDDAGGGRKTLGIEAARKYRRIYSRCREDIQVLEKRIGRWIEDRTVLRWVEAFEK